jgi:hypothetical protein
LVAATCCNLLYQQGPFIPDGPAFFTSPRGTRMSETSLLLSKQDILATKDINYETVEVPEWSPDGGVTVPSVMIKSLTSRERDAFESSMLIGTGKAQRVDMQNVRAKFCSLIIVDPVTKERMFGKDEIKLLAEKSGAALDRVYQAGMKMSDFKKEDIEELAGNSDTAQSVV